MPEATATPQAEDWYRQILETAPDAMVIVGPDEKIAYVNQQTERLFEYQRGELIGKSLDLLVPERLRKNHSQHIRRYFASPGARPMGSGLELFGLKKGGREIPIEVSLSPVHTGNGMVVSAAIRDISDRKLAADRLSSAVESIQDAFALFDSDDRLVLCNSVYRSLVGHALPGQLVGRRFADIIEAWSRELSFSSDADRERFLAERLASRRDAQATFDVRTLDGRSLRVADRRTAEGGLVKTIWDLSEDVHLAEELAQARAAAEAASAAKSDFLSSMSHELRTPLNAILGFTQLMRRDRKEPLSERHRERIEQILKGGEHLLHLIDDILDLSRIEAGGLSMSVEPVSVTEVLSEVNSTLENMASRSGLTLEVAQLPRDLPMIAADRTRFAQILMNLGSNAIKYNRPSGKVTFTVTLPSPAHVRVTVSDTGFGIAIEKQGKLFQPFQRAGQETGPIEGTGIGLVITKRLAELMNGNIGFRSVPEEGSEFWVELPAHLQAEQAAAPKTKGLEAEYAGSKEHQRVVLYVEDNPANVLFMKDLLGNFEGIHLVTAPTAEMGIELARSERPAVIVMDINLPGMSGIDALQTLRTLPETIDVPVIALTAAASERDRQRGESAGFFRYLTKPLRVDEFEAALEEVFAALPPP
jgi:PAS domain S-box-containing protein